MVRDSFCAVEKFMLIAIHNDFIGDCQHFIDPHPLSNYTERL